MDENRKLLDELMGANRNGDVDEDKRHKITDANICRNFLCGFCPPELFTNTKSALATCYKVHDDVLQKEYERMIESGESYKHGFEFRFVEELSDLVKSLDLRVQKNKERIAADKEFQNEKPLEPAQQEMVDNLQTRIQAVLKQMEELAEAGQVEKSQSLLTVQADLVRQKEAVIKAARRSADDREMEVCGLCGAMLVKNDTEERTRSHFSGKQHLGFEKIRKTIEEFQERWKKDEKDPSQFLHQRRDYGRRDDRYGGRGGGGRDYRDRGGERDRYNRGGSGDWRDRGGRESDMKDRRDRERDRRGGGRDYRDRDFRDRRDYRDRDYRDRDRERDRDRDRDYRDRDRDREPRDRERDRDRDYRDRERDRDRGSRKREREEGGEVEGEVDAQRRKLE